MKIVNLDAVTTNPGDLSWDFLKKYADDVEIYERTCSDEILERAKGAEILIINKTVLNSDLLLKLSPELKYIGLQSTGYNVVDLETASKLGITVCNIPSYSTEAVAQQVFAFILHFTNMVSFHSESVHNGDWCRCPNFCYWKSPLSELQGKTIGIIGFGSIGKKVAEIAESFSMNIIINSRSEKELKAFKNARQSNLDELLANSDFVTCHCPLTVETKNLINFENLSKMKKSAVLINTSRGPVVDEYALAQALNERRLYGAAVDVLSKEPPDANNPLLTAENCIITPHIAWAAKETRARLLNILENNIKSYLSGNVQNKVN
ncbi:MAG: D-2-hydroxyacid dehydrogenase [Clostridiales bacterium]|nr:D-2-hydroxyacid dehydrogenase [Clostridiales bacterium]